MLRRSLTSAVVGLTLTLAGCVAGGPAGDSERARLLGGLPPGEAERGVYVVELDAAGELSPGSRVGPFLGPVLEEAELLVETTAPPVTLLGGVAQDIPTPEHAVRVGTTLVFAQPDVAEATATRLRDAADPSRALAAAAASPAPVVWFGPTPSPGAGGTTLVELDTDDVTFTVAPASAVAVDRMQTELNDGGPPGSPGKTWPTLLGDAEAHQDGDRVIVTAAPRDLPGALLRSLLDQQQLTFLTR